MPLSVSRAKGVMACPVPWTETRFDAPTFALLASSVPLSSLVYGYFCEHAK